MVDTNEAYKPSQRWILLVGLGSLVWARLKTVYLTTILGLENNNSFPTLKSLPAAARLPVISQSKLLSTRQRCRLQIAPMVDYRLQSPWKYHHFYEWLICSSICSISILNFKLLHSLIFLILIWVSFVHW